MMPCETKAFFILIGLELLKTLMSLPVYTAGTETSFSFMT